MLGSSEFPLDGAIIQVKESITEYRSFNGKIILIIVIAGLISCLANGAICLIYRKTKTIRMASPVLLCMKTIGHVLIYVSFLFYFNIPVLYTCRAKMWLQLIGYCLIISPLCSRGLFIFYQSRNINRNYTSLTEQILRRYGIFIFILFFLALEVVSH